ncbi:MAG: hypothetical protein ACRCZF_16160, partial [Gemmataceae bacterium]
VRRLSIEGFAVSVPASPEFGIDFGFSHHRDEAFMGPNELFPEVFRRWELLHDSWNQFLFASAAVVGVAMVLRQRATDPKFGRVLMIGYIVYAGGHLLTMLHLLKQWRGVADLLREQWPPMLSKIKWFQQLENSGIVDSPHPLWVIPHHLLIDILVVVALRYLLRAKPGEEMNRSQDAIGH